MKLFFMSDIHGSPYFLEKALECFKAEKADNMIISGDILYHGPRNPIPEGYNPSRAADMLNQYKEKIIAVRGNCDSEVDQMLLEFPMSGDYAVILYNGVRIFLTHGHIYNPGKLPPLSKGDVLVYGHIHIPVAEKEKDIFILNPGSITFPKEGNPNSYGVLENNIFSIKDFSGNVIKEIKIKD